MSLNKYVKLTSFSNEANSNAVDSTALLPRIKQLPNDVVNKIAAGEVIQRPFNAVKELTENSLDAGSTLIQISLRAGGLKLIQVQDNGHGIQADDMPILCERFTTSKLKAFEDLCQLGTFGFRGEALASLSYVSNLSVITRTQGTSCALKAVYSEGKMVDERPRPCAGNPGTNVIAEDLFFNVPVRLQALRSAREEFARVAEVISKYSVHFAGRCGFFLRQLDKKPMALGQGGDLRTAANWSRRDVIRTVFGQRVVSELLPLTSCQSYESESTRIAIERLGLRFDGLLTNPGKITSEGTPSVQLVLFINDRLVDCVAIRRAIEAAYAALLPHRAASFYAPARQDAAVGPKSSPADLSTLISRSASSASALFVYLGIQLPTRMLDVNVHPTKAEVHFLHEDEIVSGLRDAIEQGLLSSAGTRNVLVRALQVSSESVSPKMTQLNSSFMSSPTVSTQPKNQRRSLVGTPSPARPQNVVRTDAHLQRLEAFVLSSQDVSSRSPADNGRSPSPELETDDETQAISETERAPDDPLPELAESSSLKMHTSSSRPPTTTRRRSVLLASVIAMRKAIEVRASADAQAILRDCVFVGCASRALCLVQQSTNLLLLRLSPLVKELFYQLAVANFANHGEMILSRPAPVQVLLELGIGSISPELPPSDVTELALRGVRMLRKRSDMLWDYFSLKFSDEESDSGPQLCLRILPVLLARYTPDLNQLPLFLLRLVQDVNWNDEAACFDDVCRALARFYASRAQPHHAWKQGIQAKDSTDDNSSSSDSEVCDETVVSGNKENECKRVRLPWKWTVEHVLLPAIRTTLLPSQQMCFPDISYGTSEQALSPALLKLTSLSDLYRVFERC